MAGTGGRSRGQGRKAGSSVPRKAAARVSRAQRRKPSSTEWLSRQLNDPYVAEARRLGYRSRAAFKLIELDDRYRLLRPGARVVDFGCAPGGWTQVAVERVGVGGRVVGIDIAETAPIVGAVILRADIHDPSVPVAVMAELSRLADVVLSDIAPSTTGHAPTGHLRNPEARRQFCRKGISGRRSGHAARRAQGRFRRGPPRQAAGEPRPVGGNLCDRARISRLTLALSRDRTFAPRILAADADRGTAPRDQKRAREAARSDSTGTAEARIIARCWIPEFGPTRRQRLRAGRERDHDGQSGTSGSNADTHYRQEIR